MFDREELVNLIQSAVDGCATYWAELIADHLIANGVITNGWKYEAIEKFIRRFIDSKLLNDREYADGELYYQDVQKELDKLYNITQKYGKWEQVQKWATKAKYRCSVCGREIMSATKVNMEKYPYCHCGAKMVEG